MSKLMIVEPMVFTVTASRGTGAANLGTRDPKEVWADSAAGTAVLSFDLGYARAIDTICLTYVRPPAAGADWSINAGIDSANDVLQGAARLRVPDVPDRFAVTSHALWTGPAKIARYLTITVYQPGGSPALTIGAAVIGKAFIADLGQEWGFGRQPLDTGVATSLPSGGFAVVDGVRKRRSAWTFGDLSIDETEQLEQLGLALGETKPALVIEDDARAAGLRSRILYGRFEKWKQWERRNRKQTRWELGFEEWL